jgi:hemolysin-activating ACP:hemolysin acyltransferase
MRGVRKDAQIGEAAGETAPPRDAAGAGTQPANPGAGRQASGAGAPANGAKAQAPSPALDEKAQAFWRGKLAAANFAGAVSLFMRSPAHRHYTLADLEWCLIPALVLNQFMAAEARLPNGQAMPTAIVLWARVSAEIDARLSAAPRYPIRLHPNEWQSGDVIWIIDALGEPKAVQQCIEALTKTAFQGKQLKMLSAGANARDK